MLEWLEFAFGKLPCSVELCLESVLLRVLVRLDTRPS